MKLTNMPLSKELRANKMNQRKLGTNVLKVKFKGQITRQQRIISVNAGHVRGGHSFH